MARVNVEVSALVAAKAIAQQIKMDRRKVIGTLVDLWHDSQAFGATEVSLSQIAAWTGIKKPTSLAALVGALEQHGILKNSRAGFWTIIGNAKHIENLKQRKHAASEGGKASTRKRLDNFQADARADAQPNAQSETQAPGQVSSLLCSTLQNNTNKKDTQGEVKACLDEWRTTLKHFEIDRGISERDEIQIARAVQTYGAEWVKLAFIGARKQVAGPRFNPKQFVSLASYLHKDRIERLVNLGSGKESADGIDWNVVFGKTG